jgi:hypothetical protein
MITLIWVNFLAVNDLEIKTNMRIACHYCATKQTKQIYRLYTYGFDFGIVYIYVLYIQCYILIYKMFWYLPQEDVALEVALSLKHVVSKYQFVIHSYQIIE